MKDTYNIVNGYFKIESFDLEGNLISSYEDKNQIMDNVPELFSSVVAGADTITSEDLKVTCIALGTDGIVDRNLTLDVPKTVDPSRTRLFAEENFWANGNTGNDDDMYRYVYQATFDAGDPTETLTLATNLNEGTTYPATGNVPDSYRGETTGAPVISLTTKTSKVGTTIDFEFELGQLTGNGLGSWTLSPAFSEAALYMDYLSDETGNPLGSVFSMKTFPHHFKTEGCILKLSWTLVFN